jgi:putative aminopeptidase FrvX
VDDYYNIPNRYMHSAVETIALADLDHCADLLAAFVTASAGMTILRRNRGRGSGR